MTILIVFIVLLCIFIVLETIGLIRAIQKARANKKNKQKGENVDECSVDRNH